ncbi:hypothetical protein NKG94_46110 [Micromonospora sp. M12]
MRQMIECCASRGPAANVRRSGRAGGGHRAARRGGRPGRADPGGRPRGTGPHRRHTGHAAGRVDLAAYRIVQESLTNALKHGTGEAELTISYRPAECC